MRKLKSLPLLLILPGAIAFAAGCSANDPTAEQVDQTTSALNRHASARHVVLLSIDGLHQFDLAKYILAHPTSALAGLVNRGTQYTNTTSSRPSDSFPGTLAMTTGGSPASTGIYYDVAWDDNLSPPGSACATRRTRAGRS